MQPLPEWKQPDWNDGGRVHNWHRHVPNAVRRLWDTFTDEQKQALFDWAENLANNEEWS